MQNVFGNVSNIVWYHLVGDLLHAKLVENNPTLPTILYVNELSVNE